MNLSVRLPYALEKVGAVTFFSGLFYCLIKDPGKVIGFFSGEMVLVTIIGLFMAMLYLLRLSVPSCDDKKREIVIAEIGILLLAIGWWFWFIL